MIRVNYLREGESHKLSVQGHAGYDDHGKDIVCAGVSAVSYALLGWLYQYCDGLTQAQTDSGELYIEVDKGDELTAGAFDMAMIGYLQISKKYPQNVDVYIEATKP